MVSLEGCGPGHTTLGVGGAGQWGWSPFAGKGPAAAALSSSQAKGSAGSYAGPPGRAPLPSSPRSPGPLSSQPPAAGLGSTATSTALAYSVRPSRSCVLVSLGRILSPLGPEPPSGCCVLAEEPQASRCASRTQLRITFSPTPPPFCFMSHPTVRTQALPRHSSARWPGPPPAFSRTSLHWPPPGTVRLCFSNSFS